LLDVHEVTLETAQELETLPDIYYILLDGYARASVLESFWDFDNKEFLDSLRSRGFYVADKSRSNYSTTYASLASSLNMSYLDLVSDYVGRDSENLNALSYLIENNHVLKLLDTEGYSYIHFSSGYPMTNFNKNADVSFRKGLDRFSLFLLNSTMLRPVFDPTSPWRVGFSKNDEVRKNVLFTLDTLKSFQAEKEAEKPWFVFAHIVSPHHPYVFDSEGNPIDSRAEYSSQEGMESYKEQLIFINSQVEEIVDAILKQSETPPIIILQSDHGAYPGTVSETDKLSRYYRFHNLTAVYTVDNSEYRFYDTITPVNIFRVILSGLFATDLPLLEDRLFTTEDHPYNFLDITPNTE